MELISSTKKSIYTLFIRVSYPLRHDVSVRRPVMKVEHQHRQNDAARHHEHDAIEVRP